MRKTLTLFSIIVLSSCDFKPPEKPWIIVYKRPNSEVCAGDGYCRFEYQSLDGVGRSFCEIESKYNIGDTIK